jgi:uncharacterized protein (TIGR00251 family)
MSAIVDSADGAILTVHLQPKASQTAYVGLHGGALKFRVAASPIEGAANAALCVYLAHRFGLSRKAVTILSGAASRHKRVLLRGVSAEQVRAGLELDRPA